MDDRFSTQEPVWLQQARHLLGTQESPGATNNATILDWAKQEGGWVERFYTADSIPWCGLFVSHCLLNNGIDGPKNPLSALAWADWGEDVALSDREAGCVLVFTRQGGGHVGFYVGEDADGSALHVLGGNQSDAVTITRISTDRLHAVRWPTGLARSKTGLLTRNLTASLSGNET
jgi:uncharacterized protein (TIGR02594 family)